MLEHISSLIVDFVQQFGYLGIFLMTFFEANFLPFTSEIALIPAGYLAFHGEINVVLVLLSALSGLMSGALFNYWLARRYGRRFFERFGKYVFLKQSKLDWIEGYFATHGAVSIFSGRLIPGLRHFISFPAGLSGMNLRTFMLYSFAGGVLWISILVGLGYFIGQNKEELRHYISLITWIILSAVAFLAVIYIWRHRRNNLIK